MGTSNMTELDMLDNYGYPTQECLEEIRDWPYGDYKGLLDKVHDIWKYAEDGYWRQDGYKYYISTAGWSGNEEIIGALRSNTIFWGICWEQSRRGGHYIFDLYRGKADE